MDGSGTWNATCKDKVYLCSQVPVPDSYLSAAKALLIKKNYGADPTHFNTWLLYDPARPNRADIAPESGRP